MGCDQSHTDGDELEVTSVKGAVKTGLPRLQVVLGDIVGGNLALGGLGRLLLGAEHDVWSAGGYTGRSQTRWKSQSRRPRLARSKEVSKIGVRGKLVDSLLRRPPDA